MKIGFIGLDNSGKSAFLAGLREEYSIVLDTLSTKGIVQEKINILGHEIEIIEYGGKKADRKAYLSDITTNFGKLDLIFFFFAVNTPDRIEEGAEYLENILEGLQSFPASKIIVCCHFTDPDIKEQPSIREVIAQVEVAVHKINNDIVTFEETSIFDSKSLHRAFARGIQKIATKEDLLYEQLENFAKTTSAAGVILLDNNALTMASYVSDEDSDYVLESCISFVEAWKSLSIRQMLPGRLSIKILKGQASLYPVNSSTGPLFLIVYSTNVETSEEVSTQLASFVESIQDLLAAFFD
ncbi:MAG: ADP-ribosylation factor-like protein [Candidatus Hodarchaeota archaeon]